ncbi:endopeptidase La [Coxiella endosymbiont of Amblyomma americanum]|uniref:endopeptidase La n=1 Tax=Coxiella endosymbiont of Amblyomma americanum TaxID=325775 RepID=UPI00057CAFE5|nr:endopeptidase La [Coxiella endosymbiont of Amblyomma americanum]AJC50355.1 DNA-binding protein [Coxiella endosymbiont of Amblyomma americanum]
MTEVKAHEEKLALPLLPLRDVVVFPHMVIPLFVGRSESVGALEVAMPSTNKQVFLVAQKDANNDSPEQKDLYEIGTIATVLQLLRLPDGTVKVLVEGLARAELIHLDKKETHLQAEVKILEETEVEKGDKIEMQVLIRSVLNQFEQLIKMNKKIPQELLPSLLNIDDPGRLADSIAAHITIKLDSRQKILVTLPIKERLEVLQKVLAQEVDLVEVEKRVQGRVHQQVEKSQRQYYLSEKIKAIQQELGELEEGGPISEQHQLLEKIKKAGMSLEAKEKALAELNKLKMMPPMSAEATVSRNYLDWLIQVPWKKRARISKNLKLAKEILEMDHYGLEEVKERILEYLAVQQRVRKLKGPILCLVGPSGVGKTSLGQSIANATGRKFIRVSLGGIRDEAEIRGHRRTYIGALPGKIIQKIAKSGVHNPLFMLDEVDKMAADFRGDPASALLEVLDPEQNHAFSDHYLEVDYDLSDVMFIATANSLNIPLPLLDRMEVIRLAGYTEKEKLNIAKRYLIPRQIKLAGLKEREMLISDDATYEIIRYYTREAGVRALEREIAKLCRKVVKEILIAQEKVALSIKQRKIGKKETLSKQRRISVRNLEGYLGIKRYRFGLAEEADQIGQVTGLAWTEFGGELLTIEAQVMPGKGKFLHTGRLGSIMQESIHAATTVVRSRSIKLGIPNDYFQSHDFHIHVPQGATPKDGPSAGIGMCIALISAVTKIPVRADVAMTGEITLRGEVLPIGGLKEKLLAALRGNIKRVILPEDNKRDLKEISTIVTHGLKILPVKWIDQVFELALMRIPEEHPFHSTLKTSNKTSKEEDRRTCTH